MCLFRTLSKMKGHSSPWPQLELHREGSMQEGPSKRPDRVGRVVSALHGLSSGYLHALGGDSSVVSPTPSLSSTGFPLRSMDSSRWGSHPHVTPIASEPAENRLTLQVLTIGVTLILSKARSVAGSCPLSRVQVSSLLSGIIGVMVEAGSGGSEGTPTYLASGRKHRAQHKVGSWLSHAAPFLLVRCLRT